jgi:hypothetical protein
MTNEWVTAVQRRALERALVDGNDARQYFALAGTLDAATAEPPSPGGDLPAVREWDGLDAERDAGGVLSAALLALAVVQSLDETPPLSPATDPWTPGNRTVEPVVRRGARLAVQWFDVPVERVAARSGLPAATLTPTE